MFLKNLYLNLEIYISIGHDNKGLGSGWHLKEVNIKSLSNGRTWLCECNRWFAKDEDDKKVERELTAIETTVYLFRIIFNFCSYLEITWNTLYSATTLTTTNTHRNAMYKSTCYCRQ